MVSVQVFYASSGKAVGSGKKVSVSFDGFLRGNATEYTDSSGTAHFKADPGKGTVYVSGRKVYTGSVKGLVRVYI